MIDAADTAGLPGPHLATVLADGANRLIAVSEEQGRLGNGLRARLREVDLEAMIGLATRPRDGEDELEATFMASAHPTLPTAGELALASTKSRPRRISTRRHRAQPLRIVRRSDLALPYLLDFLDNMTPAT